jgi:hypothetical protein
MKTLAGITYKQLLNLSVEEINDYQIAFLLNNLKQVFAWQPIPEELRVKLLETARKSLISIYSKLMTEDHYQKVRLIYDTEERFDLAVDMQGIQAGLGVEIQAMVTNMLKDIDTFAEGEIGGI